MTVRDVFGYLGLLFASTYRLPQMYKMWTTKRGGDISKRSFVMHCAAYLCFGGYLLAADSVDYVLLGYYCVGFTQNLCIVALKRAFSPRVPASAEVVAV